MKAIEVVGTIEEDRRVRLDEPLPPGVAGRVRLIILVGDDDPSDQEWLATQKARPAVCLTEPVTSHRHIVLAFVTSRQPDEPLDTDIGLDPQDPDFAQTGLQANLSQRFLAARFHTAP